MKFLTFITISATLASVALAANYTFPENQHKPYDINKAGIIHNIMELCTRFYNTMREILPTTVFSVFDKFYTSFEHFFEYAVPQEFYTAAINVWSAIPKFDAIFTPQFFKSLEEFARVFMNFFTPHQFGTFLNGFFNAMPSVTEIIPSEFYNYIGRFLQHVPFVANFLESAFTILQQLVTHNY